MKRRSLLTTVSILALGTVLPLSGLASCKSEEKSVEKIEITLNGTVVTEATVKKGEIITLKVNGGKDGEKVSWSSSDTNIATVSNMGKVTGVAGGEATLTAKKGEATATIKITVNAVTVTLNKTSLTLEKGTEETLTATASDGSAITWESSDPAKVSVDANGKVTANIEGEADITASAGKAGSATCHVTVVWTNKPEHYAVGSTGGQDDTCKEGKQDAWFYWADQGWCGGTVTVNECYTSSEKNGMIHLDFSGQKEGESWFGMQLFYRHSKALNVAGDAQVDVENGKAYKLLMDVDSPADTWITNQKNPIQLKKGENKDCVSQFKLADGLSTACIQFGLEFDTTYTDADGNQQTESAGWKIEGGKFDISNLRLQELEMTKLAAPTALTFTDNDSGGKTVNITGDSNAESYKLNFYDGDALTYSVSGIKSGDTFDDSDLLNGNYTVKAIAQSSVITVLDSDESEQLTTYNVTDREMPNDYDLENYGEKDAPKNKWVYWTDPNVNGVSNAHFKDNQLTFEITAGGAWYANQFFLKDSRHLSGQTYNYTVTIKGTNIQGEPKMTINGNKIDLVEGTEQTVDITVTGGGTSFSIQMGADNPDSCITSGKFEISYAEKNK